MPDDDYIKWPVDVVRITPRGAYGDTSPGAHADGHLGIDLYGKQGTFVRAPEASTVVDVWFNNTTKPFSGYGPGGVLLQGRTSRLFYLLGHLDPKEWTDNPFSVGTKFRTPAKGDFYDLGAPIGKTSALNHVHFEVRKQRMWQSPETHEDIVLDPKTLVESDSVDAAQHRPPAPPASSTPWGWFLAAAGGLWLLSRKSS